MLQVERLRELREKTGLSQRDLSRACGLAENMIFRYENGIADPTTKSLTAIAQKLDVSADYLLGLVNYPGIRPSADTMSEEEATIVETFRRDGWPGVARLSVERVTK